MKEEALCGEGFCVGGTVTVTDGQDKTKCIEWEEGNEPCTPPPQSYQLGHIKVRRQSVLTTINRHCQVNVSILIDLNALAMKSCRNCYMLWRGG